VGKVLDRGVSKRICKNRYLTSVTCWLVRRTYVREGEQGQFLVEVLCELRLILMVFDCALELLEEALAAGALVLARPRLLFSLREKGGVVYDHLNSADGFGFLCPLG
jgi:hypothetical protein